MRVAFLARVSTDDQQDPADKVQHPVPAKAADGQTKTRLVPDPKQAPVVAHIFRLRVVERLGYDAIAARLNTAPDRYPVPEPTSAHRRRGVWSGSAVRDVLHNPKYTGYMVWNRRATKSGGRVNPPSAWVWSDQPTHEPLVDRATFEAAAGVSRTTRGSRAEAGLNDAHRDTKRGYLLRSCVRCGVCDQRMFGKTRHGRAYYNCYPANNNADRLDRYPADHPKAIYVREDALIEALGHVIATRVFGSDRHAYLRRGLAGAPNQRQETHTRRAASLRDQIADLAARQDRLIEELETADGTFRDRLRRRFNTLEADRTSKLAQLHDLETTSAVVPEQAVDLLDALPILETVNITDAPEALRRKLYDALQLTIHYVRPDQARFRLVLSDDTVHALAARAGTAETTTRAHEQGTPPGAPKTWETGRPAGCPVWDDPLSSALTVSAMPPRRLPGVGGSCRRALSRGSSVRAGCGCTAARAERRRTAAAGELPAVLRGRTRPVGAGRSSRG
jgi:hypothetical protein